MIHTCSFCIYTATTEIYTLSLHDALPIYLNAVFPAGMFALWLKSKHQLNYIITVHWTGFLPHHQVDARSEEHTSELQSRPHLVCRLLLEKKKTIPTAVAVFALL